MAAQSWVSVLNTDNAQLSGTALANSTTLTDISPVPTMILPGNYLQRGSIIRIKASGTFSTTGTPTLLIGAYYGAVAGTALAASGATTTASAAASFPWDYEYEGVVRTTGTTGTIMGNGRLLLATSLTAYSMVPVPATAIATVTLDTTTAKAVTIGAQWGTASASNTITCTKLLLESKGL
jgi:hypothetical protein